MAFSFSFAGDDIEDTTDDLQNLSLSPQAAETGSLKPRRKSSSAFPIGQDVLPAKSHSVAEFLGTLPSAISYSTLTVTLDDGKEVKIPRRELWDVRVQLMAEDEAAGLEGLGKDDVKTGVYEGGFKSWESSVDLVREFYKMKGENSRFIELGCGTALPSLVALQWHMECKPGEKKLDLGLADYNDSVLRLVTLPNILLSWAQSLPQTDEAAPWEEEGELEIDDALKAAFISDLMDRGIRLSFYSGAWGEEFVKLVVKDEKREGELLVLGAETIYSPAALKSFADVLIDIMEKEKDVKALVGAKKVYFGVGGSMEDFCRAVEERGASAEQIREEEDGVRRSVVEVKLKKWSGDGN